MSSCALKHLEEDLSCHGETVGDDWLLIWRLSFPAVQLQAAAARQQTLAVHLRGRDARKLASCEENNQNNIIIKKKAHEPLGMKRTKAQWMKPWERWGCYLSGMCCETTWLSSEVKVGSCPDTWPGCPAWRRSSRVPSENSTDPPGRSDLRSGDQSAALSICVREPAKRQRCGLTPVWVGSQGLVFVDQSLDLVLPQAREQLLVQPGVPLLLVEELGEVLLGHGRLVGAGERGERVVTWWRFVQMDCQNCAEKKAVWSTLSGSF